MSKLSIQGIIRNKDDQQTARFDVIDFSAGVSFTSGFGKDFDDSRVSDAHVARSVTHFIKRNGKLVMSKKTDLVTVRLQTAFYEKKMLRVFQLALYSPDLLINPFSPDLIRDHRSFGPGYGWGRGAAVATVSLFDVSITNFYTQNFGPLGIDIITLSAQESAEFRPDWSDYTNA
jgi:hypothetical protein